MRVRLARVRMTYFSCLAAGALAGCAAGPDFERPRAPATGSFVESPLPRTIAASAPDAAGAAQALRVGNDLAHDWWTLFHSEALNQFVAQALRDNASLAAATAALHLAQETLAVGRGNLQWPAVNAQAGALRERTTNASFGQPGANSFALYNAQVSVSYTFDAFGGVRRQLEALQAQVDYQENQLRGAQLALTANVVTAVIREAQLRDQVLALHEVEKLQRAGLAVVERRFALGAVTQSDVLSYRYDLAVTVAAIAPLERQRAQTRHLLAAYAGRLPSELDLSALDLARLELPPDLPVSLPSELARQRPDILAAEALLHAASAQVGVATANLYPQITLGADYGSLSNSTSTIFTPGSAVWGLSAGLVQPIFHGGALRAQQRAAMAAFDQSAALYRQTVLTAFENVADALQAVDIDARSLAAQADAYVQAQAAADVAQKRFDAGAVSYLTLLIAQQQYRQSAVALAQARADRYADTAALFQALGGGWWNAGAPAKPMASVN